MFIYDDAYTVLPSISALFFKFNFRVNIIYVQIVVHRSPIVVEPSVMYNPKNKNK